MNLLAENNSRQALLVNDLESYSNIRKAVEREMEIIFTLTGLLAN